MLPLRSSGLLLHITSLPSPFGIGDLGPEAYGFADFLARAGQSYWQILPLSPTSNLAGESPYSSDSAFAGNTLLISPELLQRQGYLYSTELEPYWAEPGDFADYGLARRCREDLLELAFSRFCQQETPQQYLDFCHSQAYWLEDYALFRALKDAYGRQVSWQGWPEEIKYREPAALDRCRRELGPSMERERFGQYLFYRQWTRLKDYCRRRGVQILGDLPIYVNLESADVWSRPELFQLDSSLSPYVVAGVPPDYFSDTGQLWGNPVYDWEKLRETGYSWWLQRLGHNLELFHAVRIDHFRGLVGYWEVPRGEETAQRGRWREAPAEDFLRSVFRRYPEGRIVAEDLGEITPDVREIMHRFHLPGMKLLLFAFDPDNPDSSFLPHNIEPLSVAYTGTHDTNTALGWFREEADAGQKRRLFDYLGREPSASEVPGELIRLAMMSPARLSVFPVQDLLALPSWARMNTPATSGGNWLWRMLPQQPGPETEEWLLEATRTYGRL